MVTRHGTWGRSPTADVPGRRALRSVGTNRLVVPPDRLSTVGSRAFPVAAVAQIWNSIPEHIVSAPTLQSFRRHLKKFLLQKDAITWVNTWHYAASIYFLEYQDNKNCF